MNKPKKFKGKLAPTRRAYNQAIDNYEKFLPSEEEIVDILMMQDDLRSGEEYVDFMRRLAKAIAKRIGMSDDKK